MGINFRKIFLLFFVIRGTQENCASTLLGVVSKSGQKVYQTPISMQK